MKVRKFAISGACVGVQFILVAWNNHAEVDGPKSDVGSDSEVDYGRLPALGRQETLIETLYII